MTYKKMFCVWLAFIFLAITGTSTYAKEELKRKMENLQQLRRGFSIGAKENQDDNNDLVYVYVQLRANNSTSLIDTYAWEVTNRDEENNLAVAWVIPRTRGTVLAVE